MLRTVRENLSLLLILVVTSFCLAPNTALADDHVVSAAELHGRLAAATQARQSNVSKIQDFLTAEPVRQALRSAGLDAHQLELAVPSLSDEELGRLAALSAKAQADFRGGALSRTELMYIIIALATALIVLLIVKAR
jgi:hypothetical protein